MTGGGFRSVAVIAVALSAIAVAKAGGGQLSGCDPLVPEHCIFPFPNNFWLRPNGQGQLRLNITGDSLPVDESGHKINTTMLRVDTFDGFSPVSPAITYFPNASIDNCPRLWNMETSLDENSPTILLNADTGDRIMHWVELDHSSDMEGVDLVYPRAMLIWPSQALNDSSRYIVAIRGLKNTSNDLVEASPAFKVTRTPPCSPAFFYLSFPLFSFFCSSSSFSFLPFFLSLGPPSFLPSFLFLQALRDNQPSTDPDVTNRRALFADIFTKLKTAGVNIPDLQLAWDFSVGSRQVRTQDMVHMRDDAMARVGNGMTIHIHALPVWRRLFLLCSLPLAVPFSQTLSIKCLRHPPTRSPM